MIIILLICVISGAALGWWLKGKYGAKAAADLAAVKSVKL